MRGHNDLNGKSFFNSTFYNLNNLWKSSKLHLKLQQVSKTSFNQEPFQTFKNQFLYFIWRQALFLGFSLKAMFNVAKKVQLLICLFPSNIEKNSQKKISIKSLRPDWSQYSIYIKPSSVKMEYLKVHLSSAKLHKLVTKLILRAIFCI